MRQPTLTVYGEAGPQRADRHRMPVWKLVVGRTAPVEVATASATTRGWALLVPPGVLNTATAGGPFSAVLFDPGTVRGDDTARVLDLGRSRGRRLATLLDDPGHPDVPVELLGDLGTALTADERRVATAVRRLAHPTSADALATDLNVSPSQLRRLIRHDLGTTFSELRRWSLLREAVLAMADHSIAGAAAQVGFADQPHLTRTSTAMLGRTPGSLSGLSHIVAGAGFQPA